VFRQVSPPDYLLDVTDVTALHVPMRHHVSSGPLSKHPRHFAANRAVTCKPTQLTAMRDGSEV
jgi:hypothetical protein